MNLLPEWAPNIHPMLIHFPIVLLLLAPLFDVGALVFKKSPWLLPAANFLYFLAGFSVVLVFISGKLAAQNIDIPTDAYVTISKHANWALYTLILAGINGAIRVFLMINIKGESFSRWYMLIPGLLGIVFLINTADQGAKLVFAHGVGVSAKMNSNHHKMEVQIESEAAVHTHEHADPDVESLQWSAATSTLESFSHRFEWLITQPEEMGISKGNNENGTAFNIHLEDQETLILFPEFVSNLELQTQLNFDKFEGIVRLVHHFSSLDQYDFLEASSTEVLLGRIVGGKKKIFDSAKPNLSKAVTLKAVGTEGHFRGYSDNELLTHGHGPDFPAGKLGLYLKGSGLISLNELSATEIE